tara:strand:+ start:59444 stop:59764 length:321 start_codon:yes stop_codon:yes gene_type:complete
MKNTLKIIIFLFISFSTFVNAENNYIVGKLKVENQDLNCYYNYNNDKNKFAIIKESNMYYFHINNEVFFTLSKKPLKFYEYNEKKYYIGELQLTVFDFSNRYSICF